MLEKRLMTIISGLTCLCLVFSVSLCMAGDSSELYHPILDKLLKAVETNDYYRFVSDGTFLFKAELTQEKFKNACDKFSSRLKKGYDCSYLGELKQKDFQILLWKLTYKDGGDDTLARLVLKDGKVAGFWFQ
jgi:hypothetical protein